MLSKQQLEHYRQHGYAKGDRILNDSELRDLRSQIDHVIDTLTNGRRPENLPSLHYEHTYFRDLFLSPPLLDIAEQILGPDIALFTTYTISKRAGDGLAVDWHQDGAFFPIDPMETFTLWLAVDDSDQENGCMQVIPGSQKSRRLIEHEIDTTSDTTLPLSLEVSEEDAVDVELKAGEFSVHDPFILHGSNPNTSARRRCGITIKYIPTYVKIDRNYVSPTGFDWSGIRLFHARGNPGNVNKYENV